MLEGIDHVEVVYEKNLLGKEAQQATCNRIFRDIGLDVQNVNASLKKVTPDRLEDVIRNYEAVVQRLRGTEYEQYLTS